MSISFSYGQNYCNIEDSATLCAHHGCKRWVLNAKNGSVLAWLHDIGKVWPRARASSRSPLGMEARERFKEHPEIAMRSSSPWRDRMNYDDLTDSQACDAISELRPEPEGKWWIAYIKRLERFGRISTCFWWFNNASRCSRAENLRVWYDADNSMMLQLVSFPSHSQKNRPKKRDAIPRNRLKITVIRKCVRWTR